MIKKIKDKICKVLVKYLNKKGYYGEELPHKIVPIKNTFKNPIRIQSRMMITKQMYQMRDNNDFFMQNVEDDILHNITKDISFRSAINYTEEVDRYTGNLIVTGCIEVLKEQ